MDRMLAIWLSQGTYLFITSTTTNPNVIKTVNYPGDIEGLWTFIYYAYDVDTKKAVGFMKFGSEDPKKV